MTINASILMALWFLLYGLFGLIPMKFNTGIILAVMALLIGILLLLRV